ncbi:MAG: hypothetical protein ACPHCI_08140, partial [Solirubrobacterales bacterium]
SMDLRAPVLATGEVVATTRRAPRLTDQSPPTIAKKIPNVLSAIQAAKATSIQSGVSDSSTGDWMPEYSATLPIALDAVATELLLMLSQSPIAAPADTKAIALPTNTKKSGACRRKCRGVIGFSASDFMDLGATSLAK